MYTKFRFFKPLLILSATSFPAWAQTTLMDASLNNGSFETNDPSDAPRQNDNGRRAANPGTFTMANFNITAAGGFGGVDKPGLGAQEGELTLVANHNATTTLISDPIIQPVAQGDTFDVSLFTARNAASSQFDYSVSVRFNGDDTTDLLLISGTDDDAASDTWVQRTATGVEYTSATLASSVQIIIVATNNTGGAVDQVYIDQVQVSGTFAGVNPSGDEDGDGISNADEQSGALNPYNQAGEFVGVGNGGAPTDFNNDDSDGDTILDKAEIDGDNGFVTNPNAIDTDGDTLSDSDERDAAAGSATLTDPSKSDTDDDSLPDNWEIDNMLDPTDDGTTDPQNGSAGDPDTDLSDNAAEFTAGTDPQDNDSDDDDVEDGQEALDGTNPLNPDIDGDGLNDGAEKAAGTDPADSDSDDDGFDDFEEIVTFGTNPNDPNSTPNLEILIGGMVGNGSFEDVTGATNPSGSGTAGTRFAANDSATPATLPGWTATQENGFVGFDSIAGLASDGSFYAFANAGSVVNVQSDAIQTSISTGQQFSIKFDSTSNRPDLISEFIVSLIFDDGEPIQLDPIVTQNGGTANAYTTRSYTYTTNAAASSIALRIRINNPGGGQDQPKFDNVRLSTQSGNQPVLGQITKLVKTGDIATFTFNSRPGATYTLFYSPDLLDFTEELDDGVPAAAAGDSSEYPFNLGQYFAPNPVPEKAFFKIEEN